MSVVYNVEVVFNKIARFANAILNANCVGDAQVNAANPIACAKLKHQHAVTKGQVHSTNASAERRVMHIVNGAGVISKFRVTQTLAATGDSTATIDLYKNGASILSSTIVINNGQADRAITDGALSSTTIAAGDVLEVVQTVSAGTGTPPRGVTWQLVTEEAY